MTGEAWMHFLVSVAATSVSAGVIWFMAWLSKSLKRFKTMDDHVGQLIAQQSEFASEQKITNELWGKALKRLDQHENRLDNHDDIIRRLLPRDKND